MSRRTPWYRARVVVLVGSEATRPSQRLPTPWRSFQTVPSASRTMPGAPGQPPPSAATPAAGAIFSCPARPAGRVVISRADEAADLPSPTSSSLARRVHAGIRGTLGTAQHGKAPVAMGHLKRMLERCPTRALACATARCCCSASPAGSDGHRRGQALHTTSQVRAGGYGGAWRRLTGRPHGAEP